jgi:hypothetical protein
MKQQTALIAAVLMLAACGRTADKNVVSNEPELAVAPETQPYVPPPGTGPNARTPLGPVAPTIDPKSTEAAEELVRSFARLLNTGNFNEAYMLLGPSAPPRAQFDRDFSRYTDVHVTQGAAGDQEGAAGSIYLSVPLTVSGTTDGREVTRSATAILRRVNDVPGSTEAERHWHIERIDWNARRR